MGTAKQVFGITQIRLNITNVDVPEIFNISGNGFAIDAMIENGGAVGANKVFQVAFDDGPWITYMTKNAPQVPSQLRLEAYNFQTGSDSYFTKVAVKITNEKIFAAAVNWTTPVVMLCSVTANVTVRRET